MLMHIENDKTIHVLQGTKNTVWDSWVIEGKERIHY